MKNIRNSVASAPFVAQLLFPNDCVKKPYVLAIIARTCSPRSAGAAACGSSPDYPFLNMFCARSAFKTNRMYRKILQGCEAINLCFIFVLNSPPYLLFNARAFRVRE